MDVHIPILIEGEVPVWVVYLAGGVLYLLVGVLVGRYYYKINVVSTSKVDRDTAPGLGAVAIFLWPLWAVIWTFAGVCLGLCWLVSAGNQPREQ